MNKPLTKRNCRECGEEFVPYDIDDIYCEDCHPVERVKHCRVCHKPFIGLPYEDMCDECEIEWSDSDV